MKHLSQIDPFLKGRKVLSPEERKQLYQKKQQEIQEEQARQIRQINLMEGVVLDEN